MSCLLTLCSSKELAHLSTNKAMCIASPSNDLQVWMHPLHCAFVRQEDPNEWLAGKPMNKSIHVSPITKRWMFQVDMLVFNSFHRGMYIKHYRFKTKKNTTYMLRFFWVIRPQGECFHFAKTNVGSNTDINMV